MANGRKTGGRVAGTPNKLSADLRAMILNALSEAGGEQDLARQANENPSAFMTLLGKVLQDAQADSPAGAPAPPSNDIATEIGRTRLIGGESVSNSHRLCCRCHPPAGPTWTCKPANSPRPRLGPA
jgi:hypothetical protein